MNRNPKPNPRFGRGAMPGAFLDREPLELQSAQGAKLKILQSDDYSPRVIRTGDVDPARDRFIRDLLIRKGWKSAPIDGVEW